MSYDESAEHESCRGWRVGFGGHDWDAEFLADEPDEEEVCVHGVPFDEECEECDADDDAVDGL